MEGLEEGEMINDEDYYRVGALFKGREVMLILDALSDYAQVSEEAVRIGTDLVATLVKVDMVFNEDELIQEEKENNESN